MTTKLHYFEYLLKDYSNSCQIWKYPNYYGSHLGFEGKGDV